LAVGILIDRKSTAYFEFGHLGGAVGSDDVDVLYFNSCKLADAAISYSVRVTLTATTTGDERTYRSTAFTMLDVRPAVDDLDEYGKGQAVDHGLDIVIHPGNVTIAETA
jgi:hypothetical protein